MLTRPFDSGRNSAPAGALVRHHALAQRAEAMALARGLRRCAARETSSRRIAMRVTSPASIAATVLLGTTLIAGGAVVQSSPGTATRGVPGSGLGNATPAPLGDVTPAFANTPTPAFSNTPAPAFSGTPTPALPDTQTSPVGSTPATPAVDGTASGGATDTISTDDRTSANASTDGTGGIAAEGLPAGRPASRAAAAAPVDGPTDRGGPTDANALDAGSIVGRTGNRPAGTQADPAFVIVTDTPALNAPATRPIQFTMICNGSVAQAGCKPPPRFIAVEK
jgi:hypothetical protein